MEIILTTSVDGLGNRGDIVEVKDGYARNYLLPRKMALPATRAMKKRDVGMRAHSTAVEKAWIWATSLLST